MQERAEASGTNKCRAKNPNMVIENPKSIRGRLQTDDFRKIFPFVGESGSVKNPVDTTKGYVCMSS